MNVTLEACIHKWPWNLTAFQNISDITQENMWFCGSKTYKNHNLEIEKSKVSSWSKWDDREMAQILSGVSPINLTDDWTDVTSGF